MASTRLEHEHGVTKFISIHVPKNKSQFHEPKDANKTQSTFALSDCSRIHNRFRRNSTGKESIPYMIDLDCPQLCQGQPVAVRVHNHMMGTVRLH